MDNTPCPTSFADSPEATALASNGDVAPEGLACHQALLFPMHKRVITQYLPDESGKQVLFLFYGDQEISFDEPELFAFGEALAKQSRFMAGAAVSWGEGYTWPQIQTLLMQLVEANILELDDTDAATAATADRYEGARPNPLPAALTQVARTWQDCEAITQELTGHAIELAHLELVIPIFRVAHMALDREGRQVGEANVFPSALRLDVPTRWRACIYPGSRYQDDRPMNVSALKSMRAHWPQMMAALLQVREAYFQRFPAARAGWTVGDVERLSTLVLAVPTYQLMKAQGRVGNGNLHPVLSNLFRVTDGLRMTTHQMLFVPVAEATRSPLAPTNSEEIYAYAERNHAFASAHGVCAGPQAMIEAFLAVLLDGQSDPWVDVALDTEVAEALGDMAQAFDYGLRGLQAHAVVFSLWPMMTRTYEQLFQTSLAWTGTQTPAVTRLQSHLQEKINILKHQTLHATEAWRTNREQVYADIDAHCAAGLNMPEPSPLSERIQEAMASDGLALHLPMQLRGLISEHLASPPGDPGVTELAQQLAYFLRQARAVIHIAVEIQHHINCLLGRKPAQRAFTVADVDVHVVLQGHEARRLPHLLKALEALLGFTATVTPAGVLVTPYHREPPTCSRRPEFADMVLADNRA